MTTTYYRGSREDARKLIVEVARALMGKGRDPGGVVKVIQLRIGVTVLSLVQQAFIVKSRGGQGDDGIKWKPLARATIAQRRTSASERKALGITGKRVRGLLTPAQDKRWRGIFASRVAKLRAQGVPDAEALAAQMAWAILKSEGAQTKLGLLGGRTVDIGRDTGVMFRSLTPGIEDRPSNAPYQIFDTPPAAVIIGSNVPYAGDFHTDRPLWPDVLPDAWWTRINASTVRGILKAVQLLMQSGATP